MKTKLTSKEWRYIEICRNTSLGLAGQICALNRLDSLYNIMELVAKLAPKRRPQAKRILKKGRK